MDETNSLWHVGRHSMSCLCCAHLLASVHRAHLYNAQQTQDSWESAHKLRRSLRSILHFDSLPYSSAHYRILNTSSESGDKATETVPDWDVLSGSEHSMEGRPCYQLSHTVTEKSEIPRGEWHASVFPAARSGASKVFLLLKSVSLLKGASCLELFFFSKSGGGLGCSLVSA